MMQRRNPSALFAVLSLTAALVLTLLTGRPAQAQSPAADSDDLLIQGGTVLTITDGVLDATDVLVRDGLIAEIGPDLEAPDGVEVYDATDMYVMPGIIDAHSHIAVSSINEATNPVTAEVGVGDVLDPFEIELYRALAGGVTTSHVMHGSANPIGGRNETIKHRYGVTDPEALRMEGAPRTIKFALGENPTRVHGEGNDIQPTTRMGVEQVIREALMQAERYAEAKRLYEQGEQPAPPPHSERLEVLAGILSGDVIVHCHSYRADEILMLMDVLGDFGVDDVVFQHVNEGFKVAPELAAFGASASIFADWWAYKFEVYYSTAYNAAILTKNGVLTSINSDSAELNRHLYHEAAKSQKYGDLTDNQALRLITINPAQQLGIADRVGSIEVGKDADLAIFNEHPLSIYAIAQRTLVDGVTRFDREQDPDDMRLRVDPEASVDIATHSDDDHGVRCMQGAFLQASQRGLSLRHAH
jgi:imidazolonepropionase-like amidohydrolase